MHASQLLVAWLAVLALHSAAAQPAAEQAVGTATSPARAPGAFQQPLKVGVGLLSVDNFPFSQKTTNASAPDNHAGLEGFEVKAAGEQPSFAKPAFALRQPAAGGMHS